jgi:hypothetical protein
MRDVLLVERRSEQLTEQVVLILHESHFASNCEILHRWRMGLMNLEGETAPMKNERRR